MSHARGSRFHLKFSDEGSVELTHNGATVWASDADPDFVDEFGEDVLADDDVDNAETDDNEETEYEWDEEDLIDAVLDYLVEAGYMTDAEAARCDVKLPKEPIE